jgi:hypothetical protein
MTDTAQLSGAAETDPNVQLQNAADAFKAALNPASAQQRDDQGRFAGEQPEETAEDEDEPEADEAAGEELDEADEADEEAAEEAQPLPPSWGAEDAELWNSLPPEAQARIAEREGERDRGLNLKLQESANVRKASELAAKEAQTKRDEYLRALETVESIYTVPKPDPRAYGYGTPQYNAGAYATALAEYEQNASALAQLMEQRDAIRKQAEEEEATAFSEYKQRHEAEYAPRLLADVPELKDAQKADPVLRDLITYAIEQGIPEDVFAEDQQDQITSGQLHILWKAQQFDKLRAAKAEPKPKPASPAVRPGVSSPRSAQKATRHQRSLDRLAREGSVEAGAAVFKNLFKG